MRTLTLEPSVAGAVVLEAGVEVDLDVVVEADVEVVVVVVVEAGVEVVVEVERLIQFLRELYLM